MSVCIKCGKHQKMKHRRICSWCHSDAVNQRCRVRRGTTFTPRTKRKRLGLPTLEAAAAVFGLSKWQYRDALK